MKEEFDHISVKNRMQYFQWTGEPIGDAFEMGEIGADAPPELAAKMAAMTKDGPPMSVQMRPLFYMMMHHQIERFNIEVVYGQKAVLYWENKEKRRGCVMTDQGQKFEADVVLAADGLHSRSKEVVLGGQGSGKPSGQSIYR